MEVKVVPFNIIYPVWRDKLWVWRKSKIEQSSAIDFLGKYTERILEETPVCFACYDDGEIVGVNSLLPTSNTYCRSRGIYVNSEQRLKGVGRALMEATLEYAEWLRFECIWSLPRQTSLPFYLKFGFRQITEFNDTYEFGPNCFIIKEVNRG